MCAQAVELEEHCENNMFLNSILSQVVDKVLQQKLKLDFLTIKTQMLRTVVLS